MSNKSFFAFCGLFAVVFVALILLVGCSSPVAPKVATRAVSVRMTGNETAILYLSPTDDTLYHNFQAYDTITKDQAYNVPVGRWVEVEWFDSTSIFVKNWYYFQVTKDTILTNDTGTATVTLKMGCYYQGFINTNLSHIGGGFEFCHDTSVTIKKGNSVYLYYIYNSTSFMLDRKITFTVQHDTSFDFSEPLTKN